jgi:hypothetical protein
MGLGLIEVTAQEQLGAIDRASVVSMIRARLKEKSFRSKEYLFQVVSAGESLGVHVTRSGLVLAVCCDGRNSCGCWLLICAMLVCVLLLSK